MYAIFFTSQASRIFKKLPQDIQDKLKVETSTLGQNHWPVNRYKEATEHTGRFMPVTKMLPIGLFTKFFQKQFRSL